MLWKEKPVVTSGLLPDNETNRNDWLNWIVEGYRSDPGGVIVAEKQGKVVGVIKCSLAKTNIFMPNFPQLTEKNLIAWGGDLIVAPQEKRKRIGTRLNSEMLQFARSKGAKELRGVVHLVSAVSEKMFRESGSEHKYTDFIRDSGENLPPMNLSGVKIERGNVSCLRIFFKSWLAKCAIGDFEQNVQNEDNWVRWARLLLENEKQGVLVAFRNRRPVGCLLGSTKENECQGLFYEKPSGRIFCLVSIDTAIDMQVKYEMLRTFIGYCLNAKVQKIKIFIRSGDTLSADFLTQQGFRPYRVMHSWDLTRVGNAT